jgi:hypothetical protein
MAETVTAVMPGIMATAAAVTAETVAAMVMTVAEGTVMTAVEGTLAYK